MKLKNKMKNNECEKGKFNLNEICCLICQTKFTSDDILIDHLKENHRNENKAESIIEKLHNKKKNSVNSPFLILGEYVKDLKKNNSLYDFKNFEMMKIGKRPNIIGSGAFGEVFLAKNKLNNQFYAIKQVNLFFY